MGLFRVIKGIKTTKNDVQVAKYELEKVKLKHEDKKQEENDESMYRMGLHAKENGDLYISAVTPLLKETTALIDEIKGRELHGVKPKERGNLSDLKDKATENLKYLYLAKECMSLLDRASAGIKLSNYQSQLISKFSPFFDGRKVLSTDDSDEAEDFSTWSEIKDGIRELKNDFFSSGTATKPVGFSFDESLEAYADEIAALKIPDFDALFQKFEPKTKKNEYHQEKETTPVSGTIVCSKCSFVAPAGSKFCPSCGAKFEEKRYCTNCGEKLMSGAKFCAKCGTKVE